MADESYHLVSVVTPTLNAERYLRECIESTLGQDYPCIEHLFVDGGSTDSTVGILRSYEQQYPGRVRLLIAPGSLPGEAWNIGAKAARGIILGSIGADDLLQDGAITAVVSFFADHPAASFVHGECEMIDSAGRVIGRHVVAPFDLRAFVNTALHIASTSAFCRRELLERIGWMDSSGDDFDVMIRMARETQVHGLDKVLSRLRIRADSRFNRSNLPERFAQVAATFKVSRLHGGSRVSPIAMRYYLYWVLTTFRLRSLYLALRHWRARHPNWNIAC